MSDLALPLAIPVTSLYGTRSSKNWNNKPGNIDVLNTRYVWPRTGLYDIPSLEHTDYVPSTLAAWHDPHGRTEAANTGGAIHFFLDDYRFEQLWKNPEKYLERVWEVGTALTPDFSIWSDMPKAVQIWQIYRARWIGAFWQYHGIEVIPTVSWGSPETYDYCFEGLPDKSVVAVSTVGINDQQSVDLFIAGLDELIRRCKPSTLLCYGRMIGTCCIPVVEYETFSSIRRKQWVDAENVTPTLM